MAFLLAVAIPRAFAGEPPAHRTTPATAVYDGRFCAGEGDVDFLRLIDESFAFFHPNPIVPNLTMLYQPEWDTFVEAGGWRGWWIQNSYGLSYAATPFLPEPWFSTLQRSWDLFWGSQGDGKRQGGWSTPDYPGHTLVAPDGCLGDCAAPGIIMYKQGDGDVSRHDWFHEATAAGVVMQAEILLASRNRQALAHYLPKMVRACDSIERTRDPQNNLFLVGPASNLLAPSYGGVKQPDGSFGKGYLAGLSITYLAALDRMVELLRLAGETEKLGEYERRQTITRRSLPLLLAPAGYFVKSVEPGGILHGVLGQKQFNYLEGTVNADAVGLRVADDQTAASIYRQIAAFPDIRPSLLSSRRRVHRRRPARNCRHRSSDLSRCFPRWRSPWLPHPARTTSARLWPRRLAPSRITGSGRHSNPGRATTVRSRPSGARPSVSFTSKPR